MKSAGVALWGFRPASGSWYKYRVPGGVYPPPPPPPSSIIIGSLQESFELVDYRPTSGQEDQVLNAFLVEDPRINERWGI